MELMVPCPQGLFYRRNNTFYFLKQRILMLVCSGHINLRIGRTKSLFYKHGASVAVPTGAFLHRNSATYVLKQKILISVLDK